MKPSAKGLDLKEASVEEAAVEEASAEEAATRELVAEASSSVKASTGLSKAEMPSAPRGTKLKVLRTKQVPKLSGQ